MYARVPAPAAPRPAIARPGPGACHRAHGRRRQAGRDSSAAGSWGVSLRVLEGTNRRGIPSGTGTWRRSCRVPLHEPVGHPEHRLFGDHLEAAAAVEPDIPGLVGFEHASSQIGSAAWRGRVVKYGSFSMVDVCLKKKTILI